MNKMILLLVFIFNIQTITAQPYEDNTEYNKKKQACLIMEYNFPAEAVENAFRSKMNSLGFSGKEEKGLFNKDKGFRAYKDITISGISKTNYDYVVNVERKSKKNDDESVFYFLIMKDGNSVLSNLNTDELGNAKKFLINLIPDIEAANLEIMIRSQEDLVSSEEKKLKVLKDDKEDLEKKIRKLQDDIKDNEKE